MSRVEHTKGPWEILPEEHDKPYIRIRGTKLGGRYKIANVLGANYEGALASESEETRANAKRIVDCVNACEGMKDPEGEIQAIKSANNIMKEHLIQLLVQASTASNYRIEVSAESLVYICAQVGIDIKDVIKTASDKQSAQPNTLWSNPNAYYTWLIKNGPTAFF